MSSSSTLFILYTYLVYVFPLLLSSSASRSSCLSLGLFCVCFFFFQICCSFLFFLALLVCSCSSLVPLFTSLRLLFCFSLLPPSTRGVCYLIFALLCVALFCLRFLFFCFCFLFPSRSNRPELRRDGCSLRKVRQPRPRDSGLSFEPVRFAGVCVFLSFSFFECVALFLFFSLLYV